MRYKSASIMSNRTNETQCMEDNDMNISINNAASAYQKTGRYSEFDVVSTENISKTIDSSQNKPNNESNFSKPQNVDTFSYTDTNPQSGVYTNKSANGSLVKSSSPGIDLYDKLNGKTVSVSYTNGSQNNIVTINLSKNEMNALYGMATTAGIEPSMVLAIMAHESGFNKNATSSTGACGLMQVQAEYYEANLTRYSDIYNIAKTCAGIGDNIKNDPYNVYGNMAAGISALKFWKNQYGESDMLKAYAQGNKGSGWSTYAINADSEIRSVKSQIDAML